MRIQLTQNEYALIDSEDYPLVNKYKWCVYNQDEKHKYAVTSTGIIMHRLILGLKKYDKRVVHHKDFNSLNNHKCNLQIFDNNEKHRRFAHNSAKKYFTNLRHIKDLRNLINKIRNSL